MKPFAQNPFMQSPFMIRRLRLVGMHTGTREFVNAYVHVLQGRKESKFWTFLCT